MSKDSSGESLEAILASIRRSLAEQATTALADEVVASAEPVLPSAAPPADLDAPPFPGSVSRQLAATLDAVRSTSTDASGGPGTEAAPVAEARSTAIDIAPAVATPARTPVLTLVTSSSAPTTTPDAAVAISAADAVGLAPVGDPAASADAVSQAPAASPAVEPRTEIAPAPDTVTADPARKPSSEPAPGQADPLWFLSQESGPRGGAGAGAPLPPAPEPKPVRAPEPRSPSLGVGRGPLAPFFGSSAAEVVKVEMVPDRSVRSGAGTLPAYSGPSELSVAAHPLDGMHTANGEPLPGLHVPPRAADSAGSMRAASSIFGPSPADGRAGAVGDAQPPQIQALEAMVAELLRPMLRRWLDENMPRLVSAALQAELMARRDPKKP